MHALRGADVGLYTTRGRLYRQIDSPGLADYSHVAGYMDRRSCGLVDRPGPSKRIPSSTSLHHPSLQPYRGPYIPTGTCYRHSRPRPPASISHPYRPGELYFLIVSKAADRYIINHADHPPVIAAHCRLTSEDTRDKASKIFNCSLPRTLAIGLYCSAGRNR